MKSFKPVIAALAVLMMLTLSARAVDAPQKAIGENTALVVWVDIEQLSPEIIEKLGAGLAAMAENPIFKEQGAGLPLGDLNKAMEKLTGFRDGFVKAGGQGLMLTMEMPGEGSWSPPISVLAKTGPNADPKAMATLLRSTSEDQMDAEVLPLVDGWHDISIVSAEGDAVTLPLPAKTDKKAYKAFDKQLGEVKKPLMSIAFRLQDDMREMLANAGQAGQGAQGGGDPQAAMMAGMLQPLKSLDTVGLSISQDKDSFEVHAMMVFQKPGEAQQFANTYNSMMMIVPAMLAGQLQGVEGAPDPNKVNAMFMKLQMKQNGDTLKLKLDKEFFELVEELAPAFEAMQGQQLGA